MQTKFLFVISAILSLAPIAHAEDVNAFSQKPATVNAPQSHVLLPGSKIVAGKGENEFFILGPQETAPIVSASNQRQQGLGKPGTMKIFSR